MDLRNKYFFIGTLDSKENFSQYFISASKLLKEGLKVNDNLDNYISINTFRFIEGEIRRDSESVVSKNFLFIDIDFKDPLTSFDFMIDDLYSLPLEPNFVIFSGRGLWLFYRISDSNEISRNKWSKLQRGVINALKSKYEEVDNKTVDLSRIVRLVGSNNRKTNQKAQMKILNDNSYSSSYIAEAFNINLEPKRVTSSKTKVIKLFSKHEKYRTNYTLNHARIGDLIHLIQMRGSYMKGYRNELLHIASTFYYNLDQSQDEEDIFSKLESLNERLIEPVPDAELMATCRCVVSKKYKYTNAKIIEKLDITEEEQRQLQTIISKNEAHTRKKKRDREYQTNKRRANNIMTIEERREKEQLKLMTDIQAIKKALDIGVSLSANKRLSEITRLDIRRIKYIKTKYKDSLQN